jgi:hypothetical protein
MNLWGNNSELFYNIKPKNAMIYFVLPLKTAKRAIAYPCPCPKVI